MNWSKKNTLGIIVCYNSKHSTPPFSESSFYYELSLEGKKLHMNVIIFNPKEINWKTRTVPAWYANTAQTWHKSTFPVPKIIYDRCYYHDQKHYTEYKPSVVMIEKDPHIQFLGRALGGKAKTYDILKSYDEVKPFLPLTLRYHSAQDAIQFLHEEGSVLLKPNGGSHGRGIVAIEEDRHQYKLRGRLNSNQPFQYVIKTEEALKRWLKKFVGETRYIIQPFLELHTTDGHPFDIRILVQKNEKREWETTGLAVRIGKTDTITSNLHGGGHATNFHPFLKKNYSEELIATITDQITQISRIVPSLIEENHGQLLELGLDIGIDRKGSVWLLEVNSKPGRSIFIQTGEKEIRRRSLHLPMSYAYSLLKSY